MTYTDCGHEKHKILDRAGSSGEDIVQAWHKN